MALVGAVVCGLIAWKIVFLAPFALAVALVVVGNTAARWVQHTRVSRAAKTLRLDGSGLSFEQRRWPLPAARATNSETESALGALALVAFDESCAQLALATADAVAYFPVSLAGASPSIRDAFLARAHPVPRSDAANGANLPPLDAAVALELLAALEARTPGAASTVVGTTVRGDRLVVVPKALTLHRRDGSHALCIDLERPFRVEAFTFRERFGEGSVVSQAISVIQAGTSLLFVAPLPPEFLGARTRSTPPPPLAPRAEASVRALLAAKDAPPPTSERHALDRPLLTPLRALLAAACARTAAANAEATEPDDVPENAPPPMREPTARNGSTVVTRRKGRELLS
jgi:hypothetical protein